MVVVVAARAAEGSSRVTTSRSWLLAWPPRECSKPCSMGCGIRSSCFFARRWDRKFHVHVFVNNKAVLCDVLRRVESVHNRKHRKDCI